MKEQFAKIFEIDNHQVLVNMTQSTDDNNVSFTTVISGLRFSVEIEADSQEEALKMFNAIGKEQALNFLNECKSLRGHSS